MVLSFENNLVASPLDAHFMERLKQIYAGMDRAYRRAAEICGFDCHGCRDNCCRTRFFHHTMIESIFLIEGFNTLALKKQKEVKSRALTVVAETDRLADHAAPVRLMCPLNFDELCILYPYRPMICRLHGIPHEFQKPGQNSIDGPGCQTFDRRCGGRGDFKLDRTPFYRDMAKLEQEVRQTLGIEGKIKMTVAEIIVSYANGTGHDALGNGQI